MLEAVEEKSENNCERLERLSQKASSYDPRVVNQRTKRLRDKIVTMNAVQEPNKKLEVELILDG
jgi:hypothetical protein